jgi:hypothetical protein
MFEERQIGVPKPTYSLETYEAVHVRVQGQWRPRTEQATWRLQGARRASAPAPKIKKTMK